MPELPSEGGRNWSSIPEVNPWIYLLKEVGIHSQFWKSISDFISKVKELTSGIEDQFLPLSEGNSSIGNSIPEVSIVLPGENSIFVYVKL